MIKRQNRHTNSSKYSLKCKKARRKFIQNKKRNTTELLKTIA